MATDLRARVMKVHVVHSDVLATGLTAAAVAAYVLHSNGWALTTLSTRTIGALVIALGLGAFAASPDLGAVFGPDVSRRPPVSYLRATYAAGLAALGAGIATLVVGSEGALGVLVIVIVAMWLFATMRHRLGWR